jgi:hypothetical protein
MIMVTPFPCNCRAGKKHGANRGDDDKPEHISSSMDGFSVARKYERKYLNYP